MYIILTLFLWQKFQTITLRKKYITYTSKTEQFSMTLEINISKNNTPYITKLVFLPHKLNCHGYDEGFITRISCPQINTKVYWQLLLFNILISQRQRLRLRLQFGLRQGVGSRVEAGRRSTSPIMSALMAFWQPIFRVYLTNNILKSHEPLLSIIMPRAIHPEINIRLQIFKNTSIYSYGTF